MPKLFISYRREDSAYPAHSICERLKSHFGKESVFIDVDTIPFGVDFRNHLYEAVSKCDVVLAVIGSRWLDAKQDDGTRRLDDPRDFVRIEIEAALAREIPVIPVLVDQVVMPKNTQLPEALHELAFRNATQIRPGLDFSSDLDRLIRGLQKLLKHEPGQTPVPTPEKAAPHEKASSAIKTPISSRSVSNVHSTQSTPLKSAVETGTVITNSIGMKLKLIPAGEYLMGAADVSEHRGNTNETPQHIVTITRSFYLGVCPVTWEEFKLVMGMSPEKHTSGRFAVTNVSWSDAIGFCDRLSEQNGLISFPSDDVGRVLIMQGTGYRLPTEAEWEYACRAGTTTWWSFGNDENLFPEYGWCNIGDRLRPHPVGELKPNPWGLYDMHGNVDEWCLDWSDSYPVNSETDPVGGHAGMFRVLRGGSWQSKPGSCRSASRNCAAPIYRSDTTGFRVVLTLSD